MDTTTASPRRRWLGRAIVLAGVVLAAVPMVWLSAADHRDGPIFSNTAANGRADLNDIYIFQAPGNANNTVMVFDVSPFPGGGGGTPATFDPTVTFDIKLDNTGDAVEDITFRVNFAAPDANGVQQVTLKGLPSTKFPPTGILATGKTGTNIPVAGGGMFRAAIQDDPFFFDATGFANFVAAGTVPFPRAVGTAANFFGPDGNTLSMILEIPTARIRSTPANPNVGVFITSTRNNVQIDRMGRPAINTALIPPVPRNNMARGERRSAFNAGLPRNDKRDFRADMISVLTSVYGRPAATAAGLADFLLPDILTFDTSKAFTTNSTDANGFPNGRRLRDDVIDVELGLLTGNGITTDNVSDDNGDRITDGTMRANGTFRTIAFPYIGAPNLPLNGAGNSFPRP
ncbi:DUF4331 family protein [Limnoglobus roseus]|uniref:DUF4331 domain-containing protein n=1 Tax=Limnoglobus roseus TaxID=2598579 RepID=A0A5C1A5U2_9BACT|nr:DUF4331 family protein [Limnoglobus roseus]QEL14080.1 hypothetical protein PX52LOC_00944 [Limnoglobus roseus]